MGSSQGAGASNLCSPHCSDSACNATGQSGTIPAATRRAALRTVFPLPSRRRAPSCRYPRMGSYSESPSSGCPSAASCARAVRAPGHELDADSPDACFGRAGTTVSFDAKRIFRAGVERSGWFSSQPARGRRALCDARTAASCVSCHLRAVSSSAGSHDSTRSTHFFQVVFLSSPFTTRNSPSTSAARRNRACDRLKPAPPNASGPNGPGTSSA